MRVHPLLRRGLPALIAVLATAGAAGCGGGATPAAPPESAAPAPSAEPIPDPRDQLAVVAARALDRRYAAAYTFDVGDGAPRNVVATSAQDGTWRVDIPNGALGGAADVSVAQTANGVFQCALPSATNPVQSTCVKVAERGKRVPRRYDPRVQRLFHQWLAVFTDRRAAISVSQVRPLEGAQGVCYSVDSNSASLRAAFDVGIYCFAEDGLLTAARVEYGVLKLVQHVAGPATVQLPGPEVAGEPLGMTRPDVPPSGSPGSPG